jgi:8-oxo-dGTP diphosphatase
MMIDESKNAFATTQVICGVVIERDGKYLLVQERKQSAYGKWNLPSGRVERGETLERAAIREAKEETGFDVKLIEQLLTIQRAANYPVLHSFRAEIVDGILKFPKSELLSAVWYTYEEIVALQKELRNSEYVLGSIQKARQ